MGNKIKKCTSFGKNKPKELHFWFKSIFFAIDLDKIFYSFIKKDIAYRKDITLNKNN